MLLLLSRAAGAAAGVIDPVQWLDLFITPQMVDTTVNETNERILARHVGEHYQVWPTTANEIRAVIGMLFMTATLKNSSLRSEELFDAKIGAPLFLTVMSKNMWKFLLRSMRFDNFETRAV